MFRFLHRCLHAVLWAFWLAMAFLLWRERERARPLVDYYVLWRDSGWARATPLPRMTGTVVKVIGDGVVQFRSDSGVTWNLGQQGIGTNALPPTPESAKFVVETRRMLAARLERQPVEFAFTQTNALRTGLGYFYLQQTNSLLHSFVEEGRWTVKTSDTRILPLREQYRLRLAERRARESTNGVWALLPAP